MKRFAWQQRLDTLIGLAAYGFVGGLAFLLACWLVAALVTGSVVLAQRIAEAVS